MRVPACSTGYKTVVGTYCKLNYLHIVITLSLQRQGKALPKRGNKLLRFPAPYRAMENEACRSSPPRSACRNSVMANGGLLAKVGYARGIL